MLPTLRAVIGAINGTNTTFQTPTNYQVGTLRVWENGRLLQSEVDNGFDEGVSPNFTLKIAPPLGTTLKCFYTES